MKFWYYLQFLKFSKFSSKKKNYFHNFFSEIFIICQRQKSYIKCKKKNTMYETYEKDDIKDSW